ncbi:hypothetical protein Ancab_009281 [Ancistrocladus abbreviatus]
MAKACAAGVIAALASASLGIDHAYADGAFSFSPFSSSSSNVPQPPSEAQPKFQQPSYSSPGPSDAEPPRPWNDNPRTTSAGFDPEALERGAKALKEIISSSHAKKVFELMKKQEETMQAELALKA